MPDRRELALDAVLGRAAREREAGDEGADDRGELRRVGELGERERERERERDQRARRLGVPIEELEEPGRELRAQRPSVTTRKPTATSDDRPRRRAIDTEPSDTRRTTTVRITSPSTSSATAAPSTVRASTVASARRSLNTRAVMPTLVAASAAPMNSDWLLSCPSAVATTKPPTIGTTTPTTATDIEARPTAPSSPRSISMPTPSSSRITPSSPSTCEGLVAADQAEDRRADDAHRRRSRRRRRAR